MTDSIDIAGSEEIITVNNDTQDTFNDLSYRPKQVNTRLEKKEDNPQAKENQKPIDEQTDVLASQETPPMTSSQDLQNNPFSIPAAAAKSTLTDGSSQEMDQDDHMLTESSIPKLPTDDDKSKDSNTNSLDTSTAATNLRLYISPCTSLLETTNVEEATSSSSHHTSTTEKPAEKESVDKPKNEPMDTNDAQMSLGSDGIILSPTKDSKSTTVPASEARTSPTATNTNERNQMSTAKKASYALSQPTTDKFEAMLAKLASSPSKQSEKKTDENVTTREEEDLLVRETISKIVRRYTVRLDSQGRTLSRDLMDERVVEEKTTTRIESWPSTDQKVVGRPAKTKPAEPTASVPKATPKTKKVTTTKVNTPKRKAKSLKPTSTAPPKRRTKTVQSDDDEAMKTIQLGDTDDEAQDEKAESERDTDDDDDEDDNGVTDDLTGEEFIPPSNGLTAKPLGSGSRIFAQWRDGRFYPGVVGSVSGEKYMIHFDDGGRRTVKPHEIICQSYLQADQEVLAQKSNGYYEEAVVKGLVKKKKSDALGYVVEKDGKQRWYPLIRISLSAEQAEKLPFLSSKSEEPTTTATQRKRKRTSPPSQSPAKKTKNSNNTSPTKLPRTTFTPTRSTKLFNSMYFLLTGFNDMMETRHRIEDSIESHGGQVIEKMPTANRRDRVYLISDVARKTAKFFEAKKLNVPCVNYKWVEESVEKMEVKDWETFNLLPVEKETASNNDEILDAQKED